MNESKTKRFYKGKQLQNKTKRRQRKPLQDFKTYIPSMHEKESIARRLNSTTETDIITEYNKLENMTCKQIRAQSVETRLGNNIVDFFTLSERLHTKGKQQIDFYTFWKNKHYFENLPYVKKKLKYYNKERNIDEIRKFRYIFTLYFSSIAIFRPLMAMELYCKVHAKRVLDFTMGWGGRLVAAHVLKLESYIGIDINIDLKPGYQKMVSFLQERETNERITEIELIFKDALQVDYSALDYDTVFTSPPYYNYEIYRNMNDYKRDIYTWHQQFYIPIIEKTWKYLKPSGHYCLNVPHDIYTKVCIPILGKCTSKLILKKKQRTKDAKYKEYIYIWKKG